MTTNKLPLAVLGRLTSVIPVCIAIACGGGASSARAAMTLEPFATITYDHNSNVFSRPSDEPPFAAQGNTSLGDSITRYLAGATADFDWGLDRLTLNVQGSHFNYDRFSELNHSESKFGGKFDGYLSSVIDGGLTFSQTRIMAPLADTLSEQLELQTEKLAGGTLRIRVTPRWRFDLEPSWHEFDSPLQQFPQFGFRESGGAGSINYLGINKLTAGLRVSYLDGSYHGIVAATKYHQLTTQLTANYALAGFSSFDGQLGYTQRQSSLVNPADATGAGAGFGGDVGSTSTFTGALGFNRQLSVKTSVALKVFRNIDSYVAGANSEIGTGAEASIKWNPDVRFSVALRYRMATESIEGALAIDDFQPRTDRIKDAELGVEYHALTWLTLRPYVLRDVRTSTIHDANFNSTLVGIDLTAQLHQRQ